MEFGLTEEQKLLQQNIRNLLNKEFPPEYIRECDEQNRYPYELYAKLVEIGLVGLPFPEEYGGAGGSVLDFVLVAEELGRRGYDVATVYGLPIFNALNILRWGTTEQRVAFIPQVIKGERRLSISMTEPDAGSDVGRIKTVARQEGAFFILNGQKVFASGADIQNNTITMVCRTDPEASHHRAMTVFLVDNTTLGLEIRRLKTLGRHLIGTTEIFLTDVSIPVDRVLGPVNDGWRVLISGLELERIFTSAGYIGNAQTCVDDTLGYSKQREQFGKPVGNFQALAHMLADIQTEVDAARLLTYRAAWLLAEDRPCLREVSMAKLYGSETFVKATQVGMQVMGGYGYMMEYDMQRYFRDARIVTVSAGTSQMQRNIIARSMGLRP